MFNKTFFNTFLNKKVIVFGHTGFKGSWLSLWLAKMGANVVGVSKDLPTQPCHFQEAKIDKHIDSQIIDIRNLEKIKKIIKQHQPDFVFHLAAQALVGVSYDDPIDTYTTNIIGTANILDALKSLQSTCVAIIITSDKCYDNVETFYGYRESDTLGGKDPYSASKACAEIITNSYIHSFFDDSDVRIATTRAGNVIGGGDWARGRLIPDIIKAWSQNDEVLIRSPLSTRPWQHVLEPLGGYLLLAKNLAKSNHLNGESFNFGPSSPQVYSVQAVIEALKSELDNLKIIIDKEQKTFHEAGLLKLCCDKALNHLNWQSVLDFQQTIIFTAQWYNQYYQNEQQDVFELTEKQIDSYCEIAKQQSIKIK